jgi:hypothetical protein
MRRCVEETAMHAHYLPPRLGIEIYGADTSDLLQISLMATTASGER